MQFKIEAYVSASSESNRMPTWMVLINAAEESHAKDPRSDSSFGDARGWTLSKKHRARAAVLPTHHAVVEPPTDPGVRNGNVRSGDRREENMPMGIEVETSTD
jgi:hypothetical protein